jgi:hypothetical protein
MALFFNIAYIFKTNERRASALGGLGVAWMGRPKIIEVDYFDFQSHLRSAINAGKRIEKTQPDAWSSFVEKHKVNEAAMVAWGKGKFVAGKPSPVIIDDGTDWTGYYVLSNDDQMVLKWIPGT